MTPFKVVYGRDPPPILRHSSIEDTPFDIHQQLVQRDEVLQILKVNLTRSQQRMKTFADHKRSDLSFHVGDWVLIKLHPYKQHSVELRRYHKLSLVYFGPFQITARLGSVAYRVDLPPQAKIHPVFHVSMLKPFHGDHNLPSYLPLPLTTIPEGPICSPLAVLDTRTVTHNGQLVTQLLIQWDGTMDTSWEDLNVVRTMYPQFDLEDKVNFHSRGNVTTSEEVGQDNQRNGGPNEVTKPNEPRRSQRVIKKTWKLRALQENEI